MVDWRVHGLIFWAFERTFLLLQRLSGAVRPDLGVRHSTELQKWKVIRNDSYIIALLSAEAAGCVYVARNWRGTEHPLAVTAAVTIYVLAGLRVLDILQAGVNTVLFDGLRQAHRGPQTILSFHRKLLLESINYLELIVLFGLIYSALAGRLDGKLNDWTDAFYFSAVTQLTIGYGDITPTRAGKLLAISQGLIGFFFAVLVLARVISVLPRMHDVGVEGSIPMPMVPLLCRYGHDHSVAPVKAATDNPTEPWGPRPFHCPECFYTQRQDTVPVYWHTYGNAPQARIQGHQDPCKCCFP